MASNGILNPFSDTSQYVYHYTTVDSLIKYILPQKRLRFSRLDSTNDPEEKRWHIVSGVNDTDMNDAEYIEFFKSAAYVSTLIALNARVLCFSQDGKVTDIERLSRPYCDKGFARPRMWAQYGQNHTGVCLVFNRQKVINSFNTTFSTETHFSNSISYAPFIELISENPEAQRLDASDASKTIEQIVSEKVDKYHDMYFFSKHGDWKEEHEFRLMVKPKENRDVFLDIDGLLECIILGARFDSCLKQPIEILSNCFGVKPDIYSFVYNGNNYTFASDK